MNIGIILRELRHLILVALVSSPQVLFSQDSILEGVDSTRNIYWITKPFGLSPEDNRLIKTELQLQRSEAVRVLLCYDSSSVYECYNGEVEECSHLNEGIAECEITYYNREENAHKIDTIFVSDSYTLEPGPYGYLDALFKMRDVVYNSDSSKVIEFEYYSLEELKGVCIQGVFRLKSQSMYSNGKKHGEFKFYDKSGNLIRKEKYHNGRLVP